MTIPARLVLRALLADPSKEPARVALEGDRPPRLQRQDPARLAATLGEES